VGRRTRYFFGAGGFGLAHAGAFGVEHEQCRGHFRHERHTPSRSQLQFIVSIFLLAQQ
jgi:hypothetical protein